MPKAWHQSERNDTGARNLYIDGQPKLEQRIEKIMVAIEAALYKPLLFYPSLAIKSCCVAAHHYIVGYFGMPTVT